jgi:hypothetical protein
LRGSIGEQDIRLLYARRKSIIAKLATVSNGTTTTIDGAGINASRSDAGLTTAQRKSLRADMQSGKGRALAASSGANRKPAMESSLPPGTHRSADVTVRRDGPPSLNEDPYGHFLHRFKAAKGDFWLTERLCAQAEAVWRREVFGNRTPFNEDGPAKDKRILSDYEGLPPHEVAYWEDCSPRHVERLRIGALLNPEDGLEAEVDERTARIVELKRSGHSQRSIASIVGLSHQRVSQVLAGA